MEKNERKRAFIAIDVQNLWYGAIETYGPQFRVDYKKLKDIIAGSLEPESEIEAIAYLTEVDNRNYDIQSFARLLGHLDYKVKCRRIRYSKEKNYVLHSDWDVGIAVDTMERLMNDKFDTFVLVSGDGDFAFLLDALKRKNKHVVVYSFGASTSHLLMRSANILYTLDTKFVYGPRNRP